MRLTRSELKQLAGELWQNGGYENESRELLKVLQQNLNNCGPRLRDSIFCELTKEQAAAVEQLKSKLNIK
jgi:hypothetical protein